MRILLVLLMALALQLVLGGCGKQSANKETYLKEWTEIAKEYRAISNQNSAAPLPEATGNSREQRLNVLSESVIRDAAKFDPLAQRAKDLEAPKGYEEHKAALVDVIDGTARHLRAYGQAIKSGNRPDIDAAGQRLHRHTLSSLDRLIRALKGLGIDSAYYQGWRAGYAEATK